MFGINAWEAAVIALIALLVVGPDKLPAVAKQGATWVRTLALYVRDARDAVVEQVDLEELRDLDPRQYDPRRIVREALTEPRRPTPAAPQRDDAPAPFDDEAT